MGNPGKEAAKRERLAANVNTNQPEQQKVQISDAAVAQNTQNRSYSRPATHKVHFRVQSIGCQVSSGAGDSHQRSFGVMTHVNLNADRITA